MMMHRSAIGSSGAVLSRRGSTTTAAPAPSIVTRGSDAFDSFTRRSRPKVAINLDGQKDGFVNSYTTLDTIKGTVSVTVDHETRFDEIEITFEGTSRTSIERASTMPGRAGAYHTFLKLRQPIAETEYPTPRVFETGQSYDIPFTFVVPERMLPQSCKHRRNHAHIQNAHTQLPPTLGDPMLASNGKSLLNDLCPEMCQVSYIIRVTISKRSCTEEHRKKALAAFAKKVRIIPRVAEEPPLNISDNDNEYRMRKEKDVKRGLMRGKSGRMVVAASQPRPIQMLNVTDGCADNAATDAASTIATVHLRFDPASNDEQPPRLGTLWSKLKVSTFYSLSAWSDFPTLSAATTWSTMGRGVYNEAVPLSSLCVASAQWTKHTTAEDGRGPVRRDSAQSIGSVQSASSMESLTGPSASFAGSTYYTASVLVPISLPKSKAFVPTFHSCLLSRTYTLELSLSYHTPNTNLLTPSVSLKLPIQITSGSGSSAAAAVTTTTTTVDQTTPQPLTSLPFDPDYPPLEMISQAEIDDEFFRPRTIAPPRADHLLRRPSATVMPSQRGSFEYPLSSPPSPSPSPSEHDALMMRSVAPPPNYSDLFFTAGAGAGAAQSVLVPSSSSRDESGLDLNVDLDLLARSPSGAESTRRGVPAACG